MPPPSGGHLPTFPKAESSSLISSVQNVGGGSNKRIIATEAVIGTTPPDAIVVSTRLLPSSDFKMDSAWDMIVKA